MKSLPTVRLSLLAAAVAVAGAAASTSAQAGVAASAGVTNLYLWRGMNLSGSAPAVFGGLEYDLDAGPYAGVWGSSSSGGGQEVDLYAGFKKSVGDFSYNAAYYAYQFPADVLWNGYGGTVGVTDSQSLDFQEVYLNAAFKSFFADVYIGVGNTGGFIVDKNGDDKNRNNYFDVGYTYDKYTLKVGTWDNDVPNTNYTHVDLTYKYNDNIAFTVSDAVSGDTPIAGGDKIKGDPLFVVSYTLPLDFKK